MQAKYFYRVKSETCTHRKKLLLTVCIPKTTRKLRIKSFNQQRSKKTIKTHRKWKPNGAEKTHNQTHTYNQVVSKSQNKPRERERINERWKLFRFDLLRRLPKQKKKMWRRGTTEMCYLYLEFLNKVLVTCAVISASA